MTRSNPTLVWPGGKFSTKWLVLKLPSGHQGFSAKEQSGGPSLEVLRADRQAAYNDVCLDRMPRQYCRLRPDHEA